MKEKCGSIGLRNISHVEKVDHRKYKNCFQIVTPDRTYHMTCDTFEDIRLWCEAIKAQKQILSNPLKIQNIELESLAKEYNIEKPESPTIEHDKQNVCNF